MIIYFSFISQNVKNSEDEEMRETNLERLNAELVSLTALPEQPIEKSNDDSWSVSQFIPIVYSRNVCFRLIGQPVDLYVELFGAECHFDISNFKA